MIITKTPFRISFFGGGTDFPDFYNEHGGTVIASSIDKYCYVTVRHLPPFFDYKSELIYSKIERVSDNGEIVHPLIREGIKWLDMHSLRVAYDADLPARSGLGTSSSFAVGMLSAFYSLKGKYASKQKLAEDAIYLERILCAEAGGVQDQITAAFGGFNKVNFKDSGFTVSPIIISNERKKMLEDNLMLFFTGFSRNSYDIQSTVQESIKDKTSYLLEMLNIAEEAHSVLANKNSSLDDFGVFLNQTWKLKRTLSAGISTNSIDTMYDCAINAGATGGKLLGAGGGGFLLFYVPLEKQETVKASLPLLHVPFSFENDGNSVLYFQPENLS